MLEYGYEAEAGTQKLFLRGRGGASCPIFVDGEAGSSESVGITKVPTMNALISLLAVMGPQLVNYFKEKPVNAVTGSAGSAAMTLVMLAMQSASYDQAITFLQNNGKYGLIAAAAVAALRTFVLVYNASKAK